jgi:hypothetical protein
LLADDHRKTVALLDLAFSEDFTPVISAVTLVEQRRTGQAGQRLAWVRSRLTVVPVTEDIAEAAAGLLSATGLVGHQCVVDAVVVATAASAVGPARVLSSDASHMPQLCSATGHGRASAVEWIRV